MKLNKEQKRKVCEIIDHRIEHCLKDRMLEIGSTEDTIEDSDVFEEGDYIIIDIEVAAEVEDYYKSRHYYDDVGEEGKIVNYNIEFDSIKYFPPEDEDDNYVLVDDKDLDFFTGQYSNQEFDTINFF